MQPLRVLIAGLGGFAQSHHAVLKHLEARGELRLVGVCDPDAALRLAVAKEYAEAGREVGVFTDYGEMLGALAGAADYVVLPTPIALHAEMHRAAVRAGLAVYLEKPPTLDPAELEAMITADQGARRATLVGFNFMVEPERLALKRRVLDGEFGALRTVTLRACWPRPRSYFARNGWAGRLLTPDGRALLDSCLGNAMAHLVHNALHWAGRDGLMSWARPLEVRARLLRAHAVETADTVFASARLDTGAALRLALSHLDGEAGQEERVECERATLSYVVGSHYAIERAGGPTERAALGGFDAVEANHLAYARYLRGETDRPATRLEDSRAFVALNALAYLSAGKTEDIPERELVWTEREPGLVFADWDGLAAAQAGFCGQERWPARGPAPSVPASAKLAALGGLRACLRAWRAEPPF